MIGLQSVSAFSFPDPLGGSTGLLSLRITAPEKEQRREYLVRFTLVFTVLARVNSGAL